LAALQRMGKDEALSNHMAPGQLQQRPTAREGGLFKRHWFDNPVNFVLPERLRLVRAWDFASSIDARKDPDWSVGVLMGRDPATHIIYVLDVIRQRLTPGELHERVRRTAILDGHETRIRITKDPGNAGSFQAVIFANILQGYPFFTEREMASKEARADPFAAQCEHGMVKLVEGGWNRAFIEEFCAFPNGAHDDQVDAASAAFRGLLRGGGPCLAIAV
jgi:predicted phage terminase large subunit-like protein